MVDRITYSNPYISNDRRTNPTSPVQSAEVGSYPAAAAGTLPVQTQNPETAAGSKDITFIPNQGTYLDVRKAEANNVLAIATAAYSKTLEDNSAHVKMLKRAGRIECQTCKERRYQDVSNDPGVSFKSPGHLSPESAGSAVADHEQQHVANEQANAVRDNRQVISQSVRIFTDVCPECGKTYVSGGETRTVTAAKSAPVNNQKKIGKIVDRYA